MRERRLSIFNRFKTGGRQLTGEARRQRLIVLALATKINPADRTRTGIAQQVADAENQMWKNVYSGIFKDLDEVLLPMHIVEEENRLPLKRGPKALQERGVPYYRLTRGGLLVALSLAEPGEEKRLLDAFFRGAEPGEERFSRILGVLAEASPSFTSHVMRLYVEAFCEGRIDGLLPFDLARLQETQDRSLRIQREVIAAFAGFGERERDDTMRMLDEMTAGGKGGAA